MDHKGSGAHSESKFEWKLFPSKGDNTNMFRNSTRKETTLSNLPTMFYQMSIVIQGHKGLHRRYGIIDFGPLNSPLSSLFFYGKYVPIVSWLEMNFIWEFQTSHLSILYAKRQMIVLSIYSVCALLPGLCSLELTSWYVLIDLFWTISRTGSRIGCPIQN